MSGLLRWQVRKGTHREHGTVWWVHAPGCYARLLCGITGCRPAATWRIAQDYADRRARGGRP